MKSALQVICAVGGFGGKGGGGGKGGEGGVGCLKSFVKLIILTCSWKS